MFDVDKKILFLSIAKTAAGSINTTMRKKLGIKWQFYEIHTTLKNHYKLSQIDTTSFFWFTSVRNPWDRILSLYHYNQRYWHAIEPEHEHLPFGEWVRYIYSNFNTINQKRVHLLPVGTYFFSDCVNWFTVQHNGRYLILKPDHLIRFETLQQDFDTLCEKLELPQTPLMHLNKTRETTYMDAYDNITQDLVAQYNQTDIELFGYKFGG